MILRTCNRREFMKAAGGAGALAGAAYGQRRQRPNILFLLTDDQRWDALGCMGNSILRTPHIDRLAVQGMRFKNHFVTTAICMSSRASILTGLYSRSHGINDFRTPLSDAQFAASYPALLRQAGYRTGFVGKWGVGKPLPRDRFDFFEGFPGQGHYFQERDGKPVHLTQIMGENAERFLRGCSREQPFCLSVSFKAPHVQDEDPRQFLYDPAYEELYQDVNIPAPETADNRYFRALPEFLQNSESRRRWEIRFSTPEKYQQSVKGYYRLIYGVDVVVGRLMRVLRELGFEQNTIVIFTSDNGFYLGEHGLAGKWFMHEESIRTPLIVYDSRAPQPLRGMARNEMTLNIDLASTMLDYAGVDIPSSIQGRSLLPLLGGERPAWRQEFFYEHRFQHRLIPQSEGIRTQDGWKYVRYVDREPVYEELYDLREDPREVANLAKDSQHRKILDVLRARWEAWRLRLGLA
ncbi:MAG: sulfatase family protein [Acidobacteriota bacterium]